MQTQLGRCECNALKWRRGRNKNRDAGHVDWRRGQFRPKEFRRTGREAEVPTGTYDKVIIAVLDDGVLLFVFWIDVIHPLRDNVVGPLAVYFVRTGVRIFEL